MNSQTPSAQAVEQLRSDFDRIRQSFSPNQVELAQLLSAVADLLEHLTTEADSFQDWEPNSQTYDSVEAIRVEDVRDLITELRGQTK